MVMQTPVSAEMPAGAPPLSERPEVDDLGLAHDFAEALLTGNLSDAWKAGERLLEIDSQPLTPREQALGVEVHGLPGVKLSFDRSHDPITTREALTGIPDPAQRQIRALGVLRNALI